MKRIVLSEKAKYTELGIRKAVRSYWWYSTGSPYLFLLIPYSVLLIYKIVTENITWIVWVLGAAIIVYSVMMIYMYIAYMRTYLGWFRSMKEPEATIEFREEQLCITVDDEVQEIAWSSIANIRKTDNNWILMLSSKKYNFIVLPVAELTEKAKSFIISKVDVVIFCTDQTWKIRALLACGHISIFLVLMTMLIESYPYQWTIFTYAIGGFFAVSGLVLRFTIRCPKCRSNWAKGISIGNWLGLKKCPSCEATFNKVPES